jgi:hypothetical protein
MKPALDILIPKNLESVSRYILGILEKRWDVRFSIQTQPLSHYLFSVSEKSSVSFPALFIQSEQNQWLAKRSALSFFIHEVALSSEIDRTPVLALKTDEYSPETCDPVGTLFLLFSRYEEHVLAGENQHDSLNRFFPNSSLFSNYLNHPIADELIEQLRKFLNSQLKCSIKPKESIFNILPSHDVDRPFEFLYYTFPHLLKRLGGDLILRKSPKQALNRLNYVRKVKSGDLAADPNNTFNWIMSASENAGRTSTFYFLTDVTNPAYDHDYDLSNHEIQSLIKEISGRNHEIGLHPSFRSSEIPGQVAKEADLLRKTLHHHGISDKLLKSRYHYLRWNSNSVSELEKAQIQIDQTLGYAQKPGFRCGTCHSFPAFNFEKMCTSSLIIEPLIIMEQSLISPAYLDLRDDLAEAWNIVSHLKSECKKHGGNFTILWHNDHLKEDDLKDFYLNCIS